MEITQGEAQENCGSAEGGAFALQGVKDLGRSVGKAGNFHRLEECVVLKEATKGLGLFVGEIDEWKANLIGAVALESDGGFNGNRIGVEPHESGKERIVALLQFKGFAVFAFEASLDEADHDLGNEVGRDADETDGSAGHEGEGEGVVAGEDLKVFRDGLNELVDAIDRAAGFLVGGDVFTISGEAGHGFNADLDDGATGDRVKHDGKTGVGGHCFVVLIETFLRGLVVVWANLEGGVGPGTFGGLRQLDGFDGGIGSASGNHHETLVGKLHRCLDDFEMLVGIESGGLTGGPDGNDTRDSGRDLPVDEGFESLVIKRAIAKRSDEGGECTCKHGGLLG